MSKYLNNMLNTLDKDKKGREALSSNANLRQGADTYKQGMMDALQRDAPKITTRNDTLDLNPYTTPALNMRFQQTYSTLDNARKKYGADVDPYEDALRMTDRYGDTVRKSYELFGGSKIKDYISIADKDHQNQMRETLWGYQYQNSTPEQLRTRLEELQYQSPSQVTAKNQQNVIELAKAKGAKSQAGDMSGLIQAAGNMQGLIGKARQTGWGSLTGDEQEAMRQVLGKVSVGGVGYDTLAWDEMNDRQLNNALSAFSGTRGAALDKMGKQWAAELTKQQNGLTFEDADKYLQQDAGYSFAAGHQGDLTPYIQAASDMPNVIAKAAKSGWGSLTEPEKESARQVLSRVNVGGMGYDSLAWDDMSDSQVTKALGSLTGARGAAVDKLGKQWAEELKRNNGIYSKYDETAEQAFVLGQYRNTLEGAKRYYEEAQGTGKEQEAWDNLWRVDHRETFKEYESRPDFNANTPVNPEHLGDPLYAAVNGQRSTSLMGTLGQTFLQGTQDTAYMTPNEKGKYNWYYENVGKETAQDYYDYLSFELAERRKGLQEAGTKAAVRSSDGNAAALSAFGVLENQAAGILGAGDLYGQMVARAMGLRNMPVNYNGRMQDLANNVNTIRQETTNMTLEKLDQAGAYDWVKDTVVQLKNALEGSADSLTGAALGGGIARVFGAGTKTAEMLTNLIVSSRSAQDTMQSIHDRGGNDLQAAVGGVASGTAEWFFERYSIEQLFNDAKSMGGAKFKNWVKEVLVNAQQEGATSIADSIADFFIMGDKSDYSLSRDEYERLGVDNPDEAKWMAIRDIGLKAAEEAIGGGIMGGMTGAAAAATSSYNTNRSDRTTGKALKPGTRANLATLAREFSETKDLADKYDPAKATNRQTGELLRETLNQLTGQDRRRLIDALAVDFQETGIAEKNSRAIVQMMAGEELAPEQIQSLARDERALDALYEALGVKEAEEKAAGNGPKVGDMKPGENNRLEAMDTEEGLNIAPMPGTRPAEETRPERPALHPESEAVSLDGEAVAQRQQERREAPARPMLNTESQMQALDGEAVPARKSTKEEQAKPKKPEIRRPIAFEAGAQDGETAGTQERKQVRVSGISRDKSSGAVEVTLEDGQRVALEDAGLSREAQDLAAEAADLPQDAQSAMVANHNKGQSVEAYARGFKAIFNMAAIGQDGKTVRSLYGDDLTQEQRDAAIEAGKAEYEQTRVQRAARTLQAAQELKRRGFAFRTLDEGQTDRGGVYLAQVEKPMSDGAAAQLRVINDLAEEYGVQVRVYDHLDANGFYQGGTNIINVALDAEEEMIGRTTSHELFHFVKEWNREAGQRIQDFVLNTLRETKGYNLDERIEQVRTKGGQNLDPEAAKEDVAAESILDVLANEKNIRALYKEVNSEAVQAKNPGLWQQITNWIKDTVAKLRAGMERIAWNHPEVRAMKDQTDKLAQIAEWMDGAARQAGENYRAAQEKLFPPATNDADVKEYLKAMGQAVTLEDAAAEADGLASRLFMRAEQDWIGAHQDEYEQGFDAFRQALDEYTRGKKTLPRAFTDAGLDVPKENLFPVLAYAGRQWSSARRQMEQAGQKDGGTKFSFRAQEADTSEETKNLQQKAVGIFGKTYNWGVTGYVLPDGTRLDFSGKREGSDGRYREEDHRAILDAYGEDTDMGGTEAMIDFMRRGAIRIMPESGGIQMQTIPTRAQLQALDGFISKMHGEVVIDIDDENGETVYSKEYDRGTFSRTILADIPDLFEQAAKSRSDTARFHDVLFSQRADNDERQDDKTLRSLQADPEFYTQAMSDEETADAVRMFARIYRELEHTKGDLVGNVTGREDWKKRRTEIAQRLIAETGSKMKLNDVANWVGRLFSALDQGGYDVGEALIYARELGMALIREAPGMEIPMDEATKEARRIIKSRAFYLTDDQKSEAAASYGTLGAYMRKNYGRMKIRKKGTATPSLAEVWVEDLTPLNPGVFSPDATEADMVTILDAWLDNSGERKYSADFGANAGHYATSIGLELMGEYLDMPWTNTRVNRLSDTYNKSLKNLRDNYQGKYEKQVEKARERREAREEKNGILNDIKRMVRPVRTRVMNATDSRHIPEDLRGAAEAFLHIFDRDKAIFTGHEIQELANKYKLMAENGALHDSAAAARYDEDIDSMLQWLSQKMSEGRSLRKMSTDELKMISNIAQHITSLFTSVNQIEVDGRQLELDREAESFMADMRSRKEAKIGPVQTAARALAYKEMTPVYFGKRVGGIVQQCINDLILNGQPKYAKHAQEARAFFEETAKKHHINNWINSKDHLKIETFQGDQLELTKEQAMTLYAWWKREQTNTMQNGAHLRLGGFTYDLKDKDVRKLQGVDLHKSHVLSSVDVNEIEKYLGSEAVGFVSEMVDYLSKTVSEWGNEASMSLFGWKKYGEKWYFPYPTDSQYRGKDLAFGSKGQNRKLKNISASHALLENAHNPLKLGNFTQIWAEHVDEMAMYNAFAQKLDNLERVTNYVVDGETREEEEGGKLRITSPESAKKLMEKAMGTEAVQYLEQFINDVNGGVRGDERGFSARMLSLFKKGSVAANLSVMLQQPSAFVRAMSMVSPRYFVKGLNPKDLKGVKARMYENSGTAIIKDMGRFDTNVGQSSVEWILDAVNNPSRLGAAYDIMDEWTGKGAELADELTWCWMYSAVENEVEATTGLTPGTKEFNETAGKRFDAVMTQTQVYDSTLAKSPWMRSTGGMDKMVTSFMSEPTLWFNMLMDAATDVTEKKQGAGKKAAAAAGVFIGGTLVNALLKSLATAMRRKDDEGRTWLEKYLAEVTGSFIEDISPFGILNMVPLARDMVSIVQGYDVERADMSQVSDLWNKIEKLMKKGGDASATEWIDAGAAAANIFGIPARNVIRDMKGLWGTFFGGANANEPNTGRDIWLSILDNVGDTIKIGPYSVWDSSRGAYYNRMEQALLAGDMDRYNELRGYMEETLGTKEKTVTSGIKSAIRDSVQNGKIEDEKAIELLKMLDGDDADEIDAYFQIKEWKQEKAHEDDEEYSYSRFEDVFDAVKTGQSIAQASKDLLDHEYSQDEIDSKILSQIGDWYKKGEISKEEATRKLKQYNSMDDADDLYFQFQKWEYEKTKGKRAPAYNRFMKVYDAVDNETSMTNAMKELIIHGYTEEQVKSKIKSHIGEMYLEGDITKAQGTAKLKKYAGITDSDDLHWVFDEWDYNAGKGKKDPDYNRYIDVYNAVDKGKSINTAMLEMTQNGYEEKDVKSAIKSHIGEQYREGTLNRSNAESKLKQYTGIIDANDLYWIFDEWDYKKKNANNKNAPKYSRYLKHDNAVKNGSNLTEETNRLLNHGVKKDTISSHITSTFKPEYVALVKAGRTAEADQMMQRLLRAYEVLGYERSKKRKDIEKWLK